MTEKLINLINQLSPSEHIALAEHIKRQYAVEFKGDEKMDVNSASLKAHEVRIEQNEIDYAKMLSELKEIILDDSEESESSFNQIVSDYGFEYNFRDFVGDEL